MRRLVTRLTFGMLALALVTAAIIAVCIPLTAYLYLQSLPDDVQRELESRVINAEERVYRDAFRGFRVAQTNSLLVSVALAALVAAGFARFLAGVLSKPIEGVSAASQRVAQGDLSARVPEPKGRGSLEVAALAQNFNQMADALQTYERERRDMIASIAHDLRTPLSAVQVRLELLKEGLIPYSEAEIDLLLRQTGLLTRLVNDLRTLSLADAGELSLHLQQLDLGELVAGVLKSYDHRAHAKGVALRFSASEGDVCVTADAQRLAQILGNLLDNALRATPEGGTVRVDLSAHGGRVTLSVEDDGPGVPESLLPHIFDRFVQGKDKTGSSGLGLAIVKTLAELHEGTVSARNRAEGGASFTVTLPL